MSAQPVVLNKLDVARAAAKAYREGRLSAQGKSPRCRYRDHVGCPCVIGAAIDDDTANRWDSGGGRGVRSLIREGLMSTDDFSALFDLQAAHDAWVNGIGSGQSILVSLLNEILPADEQIAQ